MSWLRDRAARRQAKVGEITDLLRGEEQPSQAFCAAPTRRQRLLAWLFPAPALPEMREMDGFAPAYVETHVVVQFSLGARLRVLLTGRIHVITRSKTDVPITRMFSNSVAWPTHP
jgi:hypothetical protein